jgi:hypothetical protein
MGSLPKGIMSPRARLSNGQVMAPSKHAIREQSRDHMRVWIDPEAGPDKAKMPKASWAGARSRSRPLGTLTVEAGPKSAAGSRADETLEIDASPGAAPALDSV